MAQDDQVEAVALYSHARQLLRRGDVAGALRRFQRAWRFDPQLVSVMEEIVPIALSLERNSEVTAYIRLAAGSQDVPLDLLQRMASLLTQQGNFADALQMYQCYLDRRGLAAEKPCVPRNDADVTACSK